MIDDKSKFDGFKRDNKRQSNVQVIKIKKM